MSLRGKVVKRGSARIEVWLHNSNLIRIEGVMREMGVGDWMLPLIDEIHTTARVERLAEVVLDIRDLEYANAAVWRCLVHWVKRVRQQDDAAYKLRVVSNPGCSWQRIGVPSLRAFSMDGSGAERLILESSGP